EVSDMVFLLKAAAFAQEEASFWLNGAEQVHDRGGASAAHAEVDDRDAAGSGIEHGTIEAAQLDIVPFGEHADVIAEVDEEDVFAEILDGGSGVARKPIVNYFLFRVHWLVGVPANGCGCNVESLQKLHTSGGGRWNRNNAKKP